MFKNLRANKGFNAIKGLPGKMGSAIKGMSMIEWMITGSIAGIAGAVGMGMRKSPGERARSGDKRYWLK